ncbi:ABC transporter ATP-binding protein [Stenotrophomonas sp. MMGLT7]|uniref:ABC transporter ATP-binding protein n=1 Tax=Stenotrophomonas sp. MMGLT7 TaxID=2901227 RepID=UPI001E371008|nr:ABC transporter ATP-binding protein [Stenotrophomonas sp. MMGLT7]MCD7099174.1 ABC transporter ATP-binding protein [Stenotrophomonas sp. MMGLT7]
MCSDRADSDVVIDVRGVGKSYHMYERPSHRLWQALAGKRKAYYKDFWALRGVSFSVRRGQTVGIVGRNGSGKSTLLQMIAGTLTPTEGSIQVKGRVAALLELGSGFNPEFTGRENVYLNATILGLTRPQIDARMGSILAFADIGEFIDQPVRSYSSGMSVRLAFAVIAHVDADILIIDEALAVGDAFFSQKCMRFLREFQKNGTLLFVSHDAAAVTNLCENAVWLQNGQMRLSGTSQEVVESYMTEQHVVGRREVGNEEVVVTRKAPRRADASAADFRQQALREAGVCNRIALFEFDPDNVGQEFGAQGARIVDVRLADADGNPILMFEGGELVRLEIRVVLEQALDNLIVGFYVKDRLGQRLFGDNSYFACKDVPVGGQPGETVVGSFLFRMPVMPSGSYMIDAAVASGDQHDHTQQHWIHDALEFRAIDETMRFGLLGLPMLEITLEKHDA